MANKNFVVKNGLTVGNLDINADSGNLTSSGSVISAAVYTSNLFYANGTPYTTIGYTGSQGTGFTGSQGTTGFSGSSGTTGFAGSAGIDGYTGSQGTAGYAGSTGFAGSQGDVGYVGSQGVAGYSGSQGNIGYTGSQGIAGYTGSQGATGFAGSKGDTGLGFTVAKSYSSVAALTADTSPTGIVAGQFAIIETGDVEDPENSRLYLWTGSAYTYVNDLSGAAGITGPQGTTGFTGSQGTAGYSGSTGTTGFTGSFGADGYTGSQGLIGYSGSTGFVGSQGDTGYVGSQGVIGYTGSQGTTGFVGSQGDLGYTGSFGSIGFTGSRGNQGDFGYTGSQGIPGTAAAVGFTGSQGFTGSIGSIGPQGLPGIATSSVVLDSFTGNGSVTNFTLSVNPTDENQTIVNVDGNLILKTAYSVTNNVLTFNSAPANGAAIEVATLVYGTSAFVTRTYTGDGSTTAYTVTSGVTANSVIVADNGVIQTPVNDYTVTGTSLTFAVAPASGALIQIREIPAGTPGPAGGLGFTGSQGSTGYVGSQGDTGYVGSQGNIGYAGSTGYVGSQGNIGYAGSQGTTGFVGSIGSDGYTGSQGYAGSAGTIGVDGYTGSQGNIGYTGSQGDTGFVGSQGNIGYSGSSGYTGSRGDTGLGFAIAKSYASVAALTADTSPTGIVAGQFAIIETGNVDDAENSRLYLWTGSAYTYVNDLSGAIGLTGPQGTTGFTGSQGITGFVGSQGVIGYSGSKGDLGYTGSQGDTGFVGSAGTVTNWTTKTANYTAQNADRIIANTAAGTFTVSLPSTPSTGDFVEISDGSSFFVNPLYVSRNGSTIESQSIDLEINIPAINVQFLYDGATWQIITNAGLTGNTGYTGSKGNPGGNGYSIISVTGNITLSANTKAVVDTDTANITLTLPTPSAFGDEVFVIDGTGNASVHAITVARNGHLIQGLAEDMVVNTDRAAFGLTYFNATHGWVLNNV